MSQQVRTTRIATMGIALCVAFVTLIVVHSPIATAGIPQGTIVTSPNATFQHEQLNANDCVGSSFCVAVGSYDTGSYDQTFIKEWTGTSWSIVTSPDANSSQSNDLQGVSCTSATFCMATGYYYTGSYDQTLVEEWNGTSWSIVTSQNTSTSQNNELYGVSCTSASFCMATGYYYTGSNSQTLIEEWSGTSWSIATSPNTSSTQDNNLTGVSCTSTSFCMAVGSYYNSSTDTLSLVYTGSSWSLSYPANPSTYNVLNGVSCIGNTYCVASGNYQNSNTYNLAESWNGTSWTNLAVPSPGTAQDGLLSASCVSTTLCKVAGFVGANSSLPTPEVWTWSGTTWTEDTVSGQQPSYDENLLTGVSCTSTTFCMAVGNYYPNPESSYTSHSLFVQWNGTSWSLDTGAAMPGITISNQLHGVSCTSTTFCMAVGTDTPPNNTVGTSQLWNGSSWTLVDPGQTTWWYGGDETLLSVSCTSSTYCMAVGYILLGSLESTFAAVWNGTYWASTWPPNVNTTYNNVLLSVSCTSASFCMAAGYYNDGSYDQTLIEEWNGSSWSIVTSPNTSTTENNYLYGVSCTSTSFCMATGYYLPSSYQTLIEEWNGTSWSIVASPNEIPTSGTEQNQLFSVSCVSISSCTSVGAFYNSTDAVEQTLTLEWSGSSWSIVASSDTSTTENNYLYGVSCTSTSFCMAEGYSNNGSYDQTLIEEWNGSSWSIVISPDTSTTENNYLYGVSCTSTSFCMAEGYYYNGSYDQTLSEEFMMVCNGGALSLAAPSSASLPGVTLNGSNQTSTIALTLVPDDETGTGNGWQIDLTSTTFMNANGDALPTSASTVTGVAGVSYPTGNCSAPTNTISSYPIPVPAGTTTPTAVPIFNAKAGTGEGPSNVALNFAVGVPGYAYSGTYASSWTFTIANGP